MSEDVKMMQNMLQQQNNQMYWTLQNKRRPRTKATINDDLNALIDNDGYEKFYIPSDNWLNSTQSSQSEFNISESMSCNVSPIVPRSNSITSSNVGIFKTSTPIRRNSHGSSSSSDDISSSRLPFGQQQRNFNSRLNFGTDLQNSRTTCSDRLGTSKTSLMDFKKLLLAKSSKATSSSTTKISAVEMLKLNKNESNQQQQQSKKPILNTSMNILELNGSPKTFANRRMLKQGIFGSPSKSIMMKQRGSGWRMNTNRTDVISTSIPEVNSEEDNSSSNSSSNMTTTATASATLATATKSENLVPEKCVIEESVDLKNNMFLQVEKNNFMRGEVQFNSAIKSNLHRNNLEKNRTQFFTNRESTGKEQSRPTFSTFERSHITETLTNPTATNMDNKIITEGIKNIPALETAL